MSQAPRIETVVVRKITSQTQQLYTKIALRRIESASRRRTHREYEPHAHTPKDLVDDLIADSIKFSKSTFVLYRAAIMWLFTIQQATVPSDCAVGREIAIEKRRLLQIEKQEESANNKKRREKMAFRRRYIPEADLNRLVGALMDFNRKNSKRWGHKTQDFLLAGIATGLRPCEWERARILVNPETGQKELLVINAKVKAEARQARRFPGSFREDPTAYEVVPTAINETRIVPLETDAVNLVESHLNHIQQYGIEKFRTYQSNCRKTINRACKKAFGGKRAYGLYSARGQASANFKAKHELPRVRDLMGHCANSRTTTRYYGKRRSAHGHFKQAQSPSCTQERFSDDQQVAKGERNSPR